MLEGGRWRSGRVSSSWSAWRRESSRMFCSKRSRRLTGSFSRSAREGSRRRRLPGMASPRRALAVPIDAAVALLHAVGVPGDLIVDEAMAVALEVDTFAGGVGGEED